MLFLSLLLTSAIYALPHKVKDPTVFDEVGKQAEIQFPIQYHPSIDRWIKVFSTTGRGQVEDWLTRSALFLPFIKRELKRFGLPKELAYLVLIESGVSPYAISSARAVGPWQFMKETGRRYGLRKNWWLDERKDFEKSTRAAVFYLKELYRMFGDWYLAMAAYNMGENGLKRRIKRYRINDYWRLADFEFIPRETRQYVPKMLAIMFIAKSPAVYGFHSIHVADELRWEKYSVRGGTELAAVADALKITRRRLKLLNAELIRGYVPQGIPNYFIRVPKGSSKYLANRRFFKKLRKVALRSANSKSRFSTLVSDAKGKVD